jgi:hypothetical protein
LEEHGEVVFHSINTHIEKLLDDALARIKHDFRANLHTLMTTVRLSLVGQFFFGITMYELMVGLHRGREPLQGSQRGEGSDNSSHSGQ